MSTQKEYKGMIYKGLWQKPKIRNMPPNRRLIDSKWVFKKKIDVRLRESPVTREYTQIAVVDFNGNY